MESGEKGLGQIEDSSSFSTLLQNLWKMWTTVEIYLWLKSECLRRFEVEAERLALMVGKTEDTKAWRNPNTSIDSVTVTTEFLLFTSKMSYFLPHLPSGWHVDEAIKSEEDRVVVIRFGHDWDSQCMTMDETLYSVAEKVQNFAVIYLVDITDVPDFNKACQYNSAFKCYDSPLIEARQMYELYDPCTVMFFYRYVALT
jgi:thiol-disulfide isomerase/thioredoxin